MLIMVAPTKNNMDILVFRSILQSFKTSAVAFFASCCEKFQKIGHVETFTCGSARKFYA